MQDDQDAAKQVRGYAAPRRLAYRLQQRNLLSRLLAATRAGIWTSLIVSA